MVDVDEKVLREELIEIYEGFLKNPHNEVINREASKMDDKFSGLVNQGFVSENIEIAISNLTILIQYGCGVYEDNYIKELAQKILKSLKK